MDSPATIDELQDIVRRRATVQVAGGGSKPALSAGANVSLGRLAGVVEYEPSEFTFTALAGTPIATIEQMLAERGQYLPFDPPLVEAGATLGGTVAAGLSGPGRFRFGGVRDFLLGVRLVNGDGELVRGGGKVVKNAAGFDLPKLMVGSLGQFGILVELSCKVFPRPAAWATVAVELPEFASALTLMELLAVSPLELACLDLELPARLWLRLAGLPESLARRVERLRGVIDGRWRQISEQDEARIWRDVREFAWVPPEHGLVKIPLGPRQIPTLEQALVELAASVPRRYSVGGNVVWLAWPSKIPAQQLDALLRSLGLAAIPLTGTWPAVPLGESHGQSFAGRLLSVFDPQQKFQRLVPATI
jgi:glycolate oxidase FAD binding subunit